MKTMDQMMWEALACTTKEEADGWLAKTVDDLLADNYFLNREMTRSVLLSNIGYYTGYVGREQAMVILNIFQTRHPFFGAIEEWPKTPEQIMAMGYKAAVENKTEPEVRFAREKTGRAIFGAAWKP